MSKEEKDRPVIDDVILGLHTLPADATPWDLLKAQVQADFAPFLGPATPMIRAGGKIIGVLGSLLEYVGKDIQKLSKAMMTFGDNKNKSDLHDDCGNDRTTDADGTPPEEMNNAGNQGEDLTRQIQSNGRQSPSITTGPALSKATEDRLTHDQYEPEVEDLIDYVIDIDESGGESEIKGYRNRGSSMGGSEGLRRTSGRDKEPAQAEEEEEDVVFYQPEDAYEGEGELIEF